MFRWRATTVLPRRAPLLLPSSAYDRVFDRVPIPLLKTYAKFRTQTAALFRKHRWFVPALTISSAILLVGLIMVHFGTRATLVASACLFIRPSFGDTPLVPSGYRPGPLWGIFSAANTPKPGTQWQVHPRPPGSRCAVRLGNGRSGTPQPNRFGIS